MPTIERDGVQVHYQVAGSGPAVLLTHGFSSALQAWDAQVEALSRDHQVITWDMRGHGLSASPEDPEAYSEEATAADMAAILDVCGVEQAAVGGLSLGGYMSLAFHLAHPDRVRALLLFDTGPGFRSDASREQWNETARRRGDRLDERGLDYLREGGEVRREWHVNGAAGLAHVARGMMTQRDGRVINSLPDIAVPTLVLVGANDEPYLAGADYMANKVPGAQKVVLADAGHSSNIDQPEAFNAAVRGFLAALP
ncbi:MAG: alpha/beta fold hydrolase [Dehalococcoidia bacterium]|nr:alpha/beta fold hydrolase [Dehalococcoidia bacterium]